MRRIVIANLIVLLLWGFAGAQSRSDTCHVYVVDVAKARKAAESGSGEANVKALSQAQTVFPEFRTEIGEEKLTTKTYPFPGNDLVITASIFYTDESMASAEGQDSMLVGIVVSSRAERDAISAENNAVSDVTYNDTVDTLSARKYVDVKGGLYVLW